MSAIYDNWERLVAAVLKKEHLRELGRAESMATIATSIGSLATSFSFGSSLPTGDLSVSPYLQSPLYHSQAYYSRNVQKLQKNEEYEEAVSKTQFQFNSLAFGYEESVTDRQLIEMLGKEKFAILDTSVMCNGITTVVKRFRGAEINVATHNESYFSYKDEMLMFYEYQSQEGVSTMLHGKKPGMYQLDWESRVRIAIVVAKAIADTHEDTNATDKTFPNSKTNDVFSDLGLENMARASIVISTAGYCAPEINNDLQQSVGQESDIYSFGVLLLELLTGAFPRNGSVVSRMRLVRWVIRKFVEVGTLIVFEFVPVRNPSALVQMWKMLLLAMRCVEENPKERPKLADVVKMMDDIKMCPS